MAAVEDLRADPAASLKVRIQLNHVAVTRAEGDSAMAKRRRVGLESLDEGMPPVVEPPRISSTKRRRECDEEASRGSKRREGHEHSQASRRRCDDEEYSRAPARRRRDDDVASSSNRRREHDEGATRTSSTKRRREVDDEEYSRGSRRRDDAEVSRSNRRREHDEAATRASKKKRATEPATRVPSARTTRSAARAAPSMKEESLRVRVDAPPRVTNTPKAGERREEKDSESAQESARTVTTKAAAPRLDALSAQDALSAAIARASPALRMPRDVWVKRQEARQEMDKVVRTVEFNDPYICPEDVLKP